MVLDEPWGYDPFLEVRVRTPQHADMKLFQTIQSWIVGFLADHRPIRKSVVIGFHVMRSGPTSGYQLTSAVTSRPAEVIFQMEVKILG